MKKPFEPKKPGRVGWKEAKAKHYWKKSWRIERELDKTRKQAVLHEENFVALLKLYWKPKFSPERKKAILMKAREELLKGSFFGGIGGAKITPSELKADKEKREKVLNEFAEATIEGQIRKLTGMQEKAKDLPKLIGLLSLASKGMLSGLEEKQLKKLVEEFDKAELFAWAVLKETPFKREEIKTILEKTLSEWK